MDIKNIKMILRAVELKSLSKAAEEFSYTPSAFSHIADCLEDEIGIKILKRTHSGTELTENGKLIIERLKEIAESERKLFIAIKDLNLNNNELIIGAYASISKFLLPKLLKGFKDKHPEIKISIIVGDNFRNFLQENKLDVVFYDEKVINEGIEMLNLTEDKYFAVFPKSYNKQEKTIIRESLYSYPFILPKDSLIKRYFDLSQFKEVIEVNSNDDSLIIQMVKEGIGITVLPELTLKEHTTGIKIIKLEPAIKRNLYIAFLKNNKKIKLIKKFFDYIKISDAAR